MKFAIKFSASPKIEVMRENLEGPDNFFLQGGWGNFAVQGVRKCRGAETPLETMLMGEAFR